jgi:hypothetical protein
MSISESTSRKYFEASSELLAAGLLSLKADDPAAYTAVSSKVAAGATLSVIATISASGIGEARVVVNIGDEQVVICSCDARPMRGH